ncbi:hypothetical protein Tco_1555815 [Tanacetum coccineum]
MIPAKPPTTAGHHRRRRKSFPAEYSGQDQRRSSSSDLTDPHYHAPPRDRHPIVIIIVIFASSYSSPTRHHHNTTNATPTTCHRWGAFVLLNLKRGCSLVEVSSRERAAAATRGVRLVDVVPDMSAFGWLFNSHDVHLVFITPCRVRLVGWQPPRGALVGAVTAQGGVWYYGSPTGVRLAFTPAARAAFGLYFHQRGCVWLNSPPTRGAFGCVNVTKGVFGTAGTARDMFGLDRNTQGVCLG